MRAGFLFSPQKEGDEFKVQISKIIVLVIIMTMIIIILLSFPLFKISNPSNILLFPSELVAMPSFFFKGISKISMFLSSFAHLVKMFLVNKWIIFTNHYIFA